MRVMPVESDRGRKIVSEYKCKEIEVDVFEMFLCITECGGGATPVRVMPVECD